MVQANSAVVSRQQELARLFNSSSGQVAILIDEVTAIDLPAESAAALAKAISAHVAQDRQGGPRGRRASSDRSISGHQSFQLDACLHRTPRSTSPGAAYCLGANTQYYLSIATPASR
ncbi:MAG TPA: hypothetical protein VIG52_12750, partial [Methyloceanibacter sp.]